MNYKFMCYNLTKTKKYFINIALVMLCTGFFFLMGHKAHAENQQLVSEDSGNQNIDLSGDNLYYYIGDISSGTVDTVITSFNRTGGTSVTNYTIYLNQYTSVADFQNGSSSVYQCTGVYQSNGGPANYEFIEFDFPAGCNLSDNYITVIYYNFNLGGAPTVYARGSATRIIDDSICYYGDPTTWVSCTGIIDLYFKMFGTVETVTTELNTLEWIFPTDGLTVNNSEFDEWGLEYYIYPENWKDTNMIVIYFTDSLGNDYATYENISTSSYPVYWTIEQEIELPNGETSAMGYILGTNCEDPENASCDWFTLAESDLIFFTASTSGYDVFTLGTLPGFTPATTTEDENESKILRYTKTAIKFFAEMFPVKQYVVIRNTLVEKTENINSETRFQFGFEDILDDTIYASSTINATSTIISVNWLANYTGLSDFYEENVMKYIRLILWALTLLICATMLVHYFR